MDDEIKLLERVIEKPGFLFLKSKQKIIVTDIRVILTTGSETDDIKRSISYEDLAGLSKKMAKDSKSLVIHVYGGADEFFHTNDREDIMNTIKRMYAYRMGINLPVFSPAEKSLKDYCTTEKEAAQGLTRMPDKSEALEEENLIPKLSQSMSADESGVSLYLQYY